MDVSADLIAHAVDDLVPHRQTLLRDLLDRLEQNRNAHVRADTLVERSERALAQERKSALTWGGCSADLVEVSLIGLITRGNRKPDARVVLDLGADSGGSLVDSGGFVDRSCPRLSRPSPRLSSRLTQNSGRAVSAGKDDKRRLLGKKENRSDSPARLCCRRCAARPP
eukprot:6207947-Pleurochrysis_carterae.AAC.2